MGFREDWQDLVPGAERIPDIGVAVGGIDGDIWTAGRELVFPACSISKHVAAFGTLRLVADGTLDLDTDVNAYLSAWQLPGSGTVTVRHLLAHTAGLTENWFPGYASGEAVPALPQILRGEPPANTPAVRRELTPGTEFRYSGSHYAVLEQLLTDVTETPFATLMATLVLTPVGMADSSFDQHFTEAALLCPAAGIRSRRWPLRGCGAPRPTWYGWSWRSAVPPPANPYSCPKIWPRRC
jgi:CubicO group peptidase (beta-lactamase class C family)